MAQNSHNPWFAQAGAACALVPLARFVGPSTFALKDGGYGCLLSLAGIDEESLSDEELSGHMRILEGALKALSHTVTLHQYMRSRLGYPLQSQRYTGTLRDFEANRMEHLSAPGRLRRVDLFWCLTLHRDAESRAKLTPAQRNYESARLLRELEKTAELLVGALGSRIGLRLLGKGETFQFFAYLFNLRDSEEQRALASDDGLDRQIATSSLLRQGGHLQVGRRYAQMYCVTMPPPASSPCLHAGLQTIPADVILCTTWRPKSAMQAKKELDAQEKYAQFFGAKVLSRVMAGKDQSRVEQGARAHAAAHTISGIGEAITDLGRVAQGTWSMRLLVAADTPEALQALAPTVHRAFVETQTPVMEETLGDLSAFCAMWPGNDKFNVFPLWLSETHHARLSSVFAPAIGHPHSDDLNAPYLNIFETRTGTPFFQDAYVDGVRVELIVGPTGSGKSVHANLMVAHEQKYGGFTYIFDIGGSYESVVELYGGRVDRIGLDGPRLNPFSLEPTEKNIAFLYQFVKLLVTNGGAQLTPDHEDAIHKAVQGMYHLDRDQRRLGHLILPVDLQRYLAKWIIDPRTRMAGVYANIFDNVEDSLQLSRIQCFDFQGVNQKQHADLIEPLMVWLLRRIDDVLFDPANLGVPKHVVIEELFSNMKNPALLDAALSSIKTVRKNLGGVTLIAQSADDLGANADSIVNSCSSFLLLPDRSFNPERYASLFKLTAHQVALLAGLREREALYIRKDGITKVLLLNLDPRAYATFTTKPKDRRRRAQLVEKYGLNEGLDRFAQGEMA